MFSRRAFGSLLLLPFLKAPRKTRHGTREAAQPDCGCNGSKVELIEITSFADSWRDSCYSSVASDVKAARIANGQHV